MSDARWARMVAYMRDHDSYYDADEVAAHAPREDEEQSEAGALGPWWRREMLRALAAERAAGAREMRERAAAVARADGPDAWAYPEEHAAVEAAARAIEALPLGGATS